MAKYNCLNTNGDLVGVIEAATKEEALKKAQALNKNVREVEERPVLTHEPGPKA